MRIAVITRCLTPGGSGDSFDFVVATLSRISSQHPEHEFIFLSDQPLDAGLVFSNNVTPVILGLPGRHSVLLKWWYDIKLPAVLRKMKADVLLGMDGVASLKATLPQVLVMPGLLNKRHALRWLAKASMIAALSEFGAQEIIRQYPAGSEKIRVVRAAAGEIFQPFGWQEKELAKDKFAGGREYFLYAGSADDGPELLNIFKAFSLFKKRQMSNMRLLLFVNKTGPTKAFGEKLGTYKYREDVGVIAGLNARDLAQLTAGAYAIIYPGPGARFATPIVEAMQCGVPCISTNKGCIPELGGQALLFADFNNPEDIASQMKLIYKDEGLRNQLVAHALEQAQHFSWQKTADALWQIVKTAAGGQAYAAV